jgi:hypothetical protein
VTIVILAKAEMWGPIVLCIFFIAFIGAICWLAHKHDPFRRLEQYRIRRKPPVRFERFGCVTIGNTPTHSRVYRNSLSCAMDKDWVCFREGGLIPFIPKYWRLPRKEVRRQSHFMWTIRIDAADPPLHGDFDSDFVRRLKSSRN